MSMSLPLPLPPGFRFNPTDEELVFYYLRNRTASVQCPGPVIIADVDIYKFDPWDLPSQALYGDREWYFFSPRDRKYPNGTRPNRAAGSGYWKSTGTDKPVRGGLIGEGVGVKKALAFYKGRPPRGTKTGWIMHEFRLATATATNPLATDKPIKFTTRLDDWVLCRIYEKTIKASLMVPPPPPLSVADYYDPTVNHDDLCAGGGFNNAPGLFTPSSRTIITHKEQPQTGGAAQTFISDDLYPAAQIFYTEADHLAVHPSLNELLSGCDGTQVEPSYYSRSLSPIANGGVGKAASPEECGGAASGIVVGWPPVVVEEAQPVMHGRSAAAIVAAVVADRLPSGGGGAACTQPSDTFSCMHAE